MRVISLIAFLLAVSAFTGSARSDERLPRVLILGDFVYQQPARSVASELKGRADVVYAALRPGEVRNTKTTLTNLSDLLGERKWDVIHFNLGLGDLVYRAPGLKSFRTMPKEAGGVRTTAPEQYERNLRELVKRLSDTDAKLIWANTTPLRSSPLGVFDMGSEKEYNAIAAKIMTEHDIPINDMYSYVASVINLQRPTAFDPFSFDKKPLHPPIVRSILKQLPSTE